MAGSWQCFGCGTVVPDDVTWGAGETPCDCPPSAWEIGAPSFTAKDINEILDRLGELHYDLGFEDYLGNAETSAELNRSITETKASLLTLLGFDGDTS